MNISELIRTLRKEKNMTQQQVADKVHVTVQAINQYENGKREIKAEMLVSLLKALGYDFSVNETFENYETYGLFWDVSFYHEYWSSSGKMCMDFAGAKELTKEEFDALHQWVKQKEYDKAANALFHHTRGIPGDLDAWMDFIWLQLLEHSTKDIQNECLRVETTETAEEEEEYQEGSFFVLKKTMKKEIFETECFFQRNVND